MNSLRASVIFRNHWQEGALLRTMGRSVFRVGTFRVYLPAILR
jgi:hypothetical protein